MRRRSWAILMTLLLLLMVGCEVNYQVSDLGFQEKDWALVEKSGRKTTVNLLVYGGDGLMAKWFEEVVKPDLETRYELRLNVVPSTFKEIKAQLLREQENEIKDGDIDLVFLEKASDFKELQEKALVYGPVLGSLQAFATYGNPRAEENITIDGYVHQGYGIPISRVTPYLIANEDYIIELPENFEDLTETIRNNPGLFALPDAESALGGKLLRGFVLNKVDHKALVAANSAAELQPLVRPAFDALLNLMVHFYQKGHTGPRDEAELDQLFRENAVVFSASMELEHIVNEQKAERYPEGAKPVLVENFLPYEPEYMVIPFNSGNKSGAMLVLNAILSVENQASLLAAKGPGRTPVIDFGSLTAEDQAVITKATIKKTIPKGEQLIRLGIADVPTKHRQWIAALWKQYLSEHP